MVKNIAIIVLLFILFVSASNREKKGCVKYRIPVVIDLDVLPGEQPYSLSKKEQQELKAYYKEKKITVIDKQEAQLLIEKYISEILNVFIKTPANELEKYKEEAKRKMLSLPESSRWIHHAFYFTNKPLLDSIHINVFSSPYNSEKNVNYKKAIYNTTKKETVLFLKEALDSCIASNYLE